MGDERKNLSSQQKTGVVLLLLFGVLAVGLGFLQLRNTIYLPLAVHADVSSTDINSLMDDQTRLQTIDTDQDGLNDYEELNFYQTSPYLEDTDSDEINDKKEIDDGTDPLCPEGDTCGADQTALPTNTASTTLNGLLNEDVPSLTSAVTVVDTGVDVTAVAKDPTALRKLILASGKITQEQLDKIDDATLLKLAGDILQQ